MMWRIIVFVIVLMCGAGAQLHDTGTSEAEFYNMTAKISYDELNTKHFQDSFKNATTNESRVPTIILPDKDNPNATFINRLVAKYADTLMYATVEGARESMEFGYANPEYNFNFIKWIIILSMFAPLIIPTIYLAIFIGYGAVHLFRKIKKIPICGMFERL